ncbi:conjugative transposon protein TraM [Sphingobacterium bambusae]|uniref:Conjugative transposon protein TraM n=1 Tax=Sphingobacterium bambusae TaxID=662858 RepID=A0ABW6BBB1_9SPHI|nr:conjugative transposon protein TraM [Sphingobacterium bambusae]WPL48529.1 conjugative transposon protein TraM [Sphingobacterium bambusae]
MKIDFNKPRYVVPLILLPFLFIFFYIYKSTFDKQELPQAGKDSLQTGVADVSDQVREKALSGKLDAYRNQYRQADGYTAVGLIQEEETEKEMPGTLYNMRERQMLDSIDRAMKNRYSPSQEKGFPSATMQRPSFDAEDRAMEEALARLSAPQRSAPAEAVKVSEDPMDLFRKQMALVDSMGKANDPDYQAEQQRKDLEQGQLALAKSQPALMVSKAAGHTDGFNTVVPAKSETFISAIIDQNITGYVGSRLRIRLLEDIVAGSVPIKKGSYLYAQISGFSGQRVNLTITSAMIGEQILPINLEVYDHDGMRGLFVPASEFREFTKELGGNASQGITMQQMETNSQLAMSMVQKVFQSTSTAVSKMIRQNKAKIKYSTIVYLIDPQQLKTQF